MRKLKPFILIAAGGSVYLLIELLWRGRSAWQMFIVGGIAFYLVGLINEIMHWETPLLKQALIAAIIITTVELLAGLIINRDFAIWDYRGQPLNLYGQICMGYSLLWYLLSFPAILLDDFLRYKLCGEEKPKYKLF